MAIATKQPLSAFAKCNCDVAQDLVVDARRDMQSVLARRLLGA